MMRLFPVLFRTSSVSLSVDSTSRKHLCLQEVKVTPDTCALMGSHPYFFLNCLKICKSLCLRCMSALVLNVFMIIVCVGVCRHLCALVQVWWSQDSSVELSFSVLMWVLGTELRLPALSGKLCPLSRLT